MGNNGSQIRGRRHRRKHQRDSEQKNDQNMSVTSENQALSAQEATPPPAPAPVTDSSQSAASTSSLKSERELITGELRDVAEYYDIENKELGHGHYGTVSVGIHKKTGEKFAIKTIPKARVRRPEVMRREITILRSLHHPNIIKLHDVFEGARHLHIVMELCSGGELFDRIIARGHYSEADAAILVRKMIGALQYCHERDITHRDLKPENFLFQTPAEDAELKVIDFGLSRMDDGLTAGAMTTRVGTPYYIAPEVLGRSYDKSCDLWSIGVIIYILLCGYPPFYGDTDPEIFAAVRSGRYEFESPEWDPISDLAKDLIRKLIVLEPAKRLTAAQALQHPWVSGCAPETEMSTSSKLFASLKRFTGHNKLKKAALGVIADQMTESEIQELKRQFMAIDSDQNGVITITELASALRGMGHGVIQNEVLELLQGIDIDGDGLIDYPEFLAATMQRNLANKKEYLINAFNYFDTTKKGVITKADLIQFMGSEEQAQQVIDDVDADGDGQISFDEFVAMMQQRNFSEDDISMETNDMGSFLQVSEQPTRPLCDRSTEL